MPKSLLKVNDLQDYLTTLNQKAEHHAQSVEAISLMLAGAVVMLKNQGSDIKVLERNGDLKNLLWVEINNSKYAFAYNGKNGTVEIRQDNMRGQVIVSLDDTLSLKDVYKLLKDL